MRVGKLKAAACCVLLCLLVASNLTPGRPPCDSKEDLSVIVVVVSSYTSGARTRRALVRSTWLNFAYKFMVSSRIPWLQWLAVTIESWWHADLLFLDAADDYQHLTQKVFEGLRWAASCPAGDYLVKTDDDCFLRLDTILRELRGLGKRAGYWRGLVYRDMPRISVGWNKNSEPDFPYDRYPTFTAGALYIFSFDILRHIAEQKSPLFAKNEDQSLGVWISPLLVEPVHDRRIQQWHVCEQDMIAKHFYRDFRDPKMDVMYENVVHGRPLCDGFRQDMCALCYSCKKQSTDWAKWGYKCNHIEGVTFDPKDTPYETS